MRIRAAWLVSAAAALAVLLPACAPRRPPVLEPLQQRVERTPVVLLPGITGSRLRDRDSGEIVWGNARSIFLPRDGGYALARPLDPAGAGDRLEAFSPVVRIRLLGLLTVDIYASLIRLMEANGYRLGDLSDPRPEDDFFLFAYDWRDNNVRAARELAGRLEALRRVRGEERLEVHLICQSNASRIARWLIKYGDSTLEQAERGRAGPPPGVRVDKLILVGTDNGGGLGTLQDLDRGRRYVPVLGRSFRPETVFTFPSVYEALPVYREDLFVDEHGRALDVDLFDPASWKRHGWSVYDPKVKRRLERAGRSGRFGDEAARDAFLAWALDRARRTQRVLRQDSDGVGGTRYYMIQNAYRRTPERAVIARRRDGRTRTLYPADRRVERDGYLSTRVNAPGDGHATVESQLWLSPQEREALARPPVFVPAYHRRIILHPAAHRWILEFLAD